MHTVTLYKQFIHFTVYKCNNLMKKSKWVPWPLELLIWALLNTYIAGWTLRPKKKNKNVTVAQKTFWGGVSFFSQILTHDFNKTIPCFARTTCETTRTTHETTRTTRETMRTTRRRHITREFGLKLRKKIWGGWKSWKKTLGGGQR